MAVGYLTRTQIITQGLQQGGNPGLDVIPAGQTISLAVRFFNTFLHHAFLTRDFQFLVTSGNITVTASNELVSLSALTRFRNILLVRLEDIRQPLNNTLSYHEIFAQVEADKDSSPISTGQPIYYASVPDKTSLIFWPIPDKAYTGKILYYRVPDVSTYTDSSVVEFEDSLALVTAVEMFARNYDKEDLMVASEAIANKLFGEYRAAEGDMGRAHGHTSLKLSPIHFNYRRKRQFMASRDINVPLRIVKGNDLEEDARVVDQGAYIRTTNLYGRSLSTLVKIPGSDRVASGDEGDVLAPDNDPALGGGDFARGEDTTGIDPTILVGFHPAPTGSIDRAPLDDTYFNPDTSKKNTLFDCTVAAVAEEYKADAIFSFDKFYKSKGFKLASEL